MFQSFLYHTQWLYGKIYNWRKSQPCFDPRFENFACLASLKTCDTMKQYEWLYIYISLLTHTHNGIHFRRQCLEVHRSGRAYTRSGTSRSRLSDKLAFISGVLRPVSLSFWEPSYQILTFLGRARFISGAWCALFHGNVDETWGIFRATGRVWATPQRLDPPNTRPCATLVRSVGRTTNTYTHTHRDFRVIKWV